jgi:hypothetical protein
MKAEGHVRPNFRGGRDVEPLSLRVEQRLIALDRVARSDSSGHPVRVLRRVVQAASAINGQVRPTASSLRPEVSLLVGEVREKTATAFSLGGPLTRQELELVEVPADPLVLPWILPEAQAKAGDHWKLPEIVARSLTSYDALAANSLEAKLESLDDAQARIRVTGDVRGAVLGAEGSITCSGLLTFDRKAGLIDRFELERNERRAAGPVEAGLELRSNVTLTRTREPQPADLSDAVAKDIPADASPDRDDLLLVAQSGRYTLRHDRAWHIFAEDTRQTVLKRLDRGSLVSQCNLTLGPNAGKGRHQDLAQFRDDIRRALGARFGRISSAGEVEGLDGGIFCYRVAVEGHEGEVGVVWYYYLVAWPDGDQLLVAFTLGQAQARQFGDEDLRLIGTIEWKGENAVAPKPAETGAAGSSK